MKKKILKTMILIILCLAMLGSCTVLGLNLWVLRTGTRILQPEAAALLQDMDCILVLGCQVMRDGTPSHMLEDRLRRGVELFERNTAPKLLMSGDHGQEDYNEVRTMKRYATDAGVASSHVFMDHAGFSTYESLYRAKHVFQVKRVVIVTQKYHLYRALHIADALGIEAWGVAADYRSYAGQSVREVREILARVKDFGTGIFQPKPTYLGTPIPISGDGDITNN